MVFPVRHGQTWGNRQL